MITLSIPDNDTLQDPATVPIKSPEAREQARLVACLKRHWMWQSVPPIIFAVPNGGSRDKREAANLKIQGALAGVPDLCIVFEFGCTIWIEMKSKEAKGRVSKEQKCLHEQFMDLGHTVIVAYSAEDALDQLRNYNG